MFNVSDFAAAVNAAKGVRDLASPPANGSHCCCSHQERTRPGYLTAGDPEEVFGTKELTAPAVIGEVRADAEPDSGCSCGRG